MTVLVTGATGLVGNNVVRLLRADQVPVRVLVRANADPRPLAGLGVETVEGDVCDAAAVETAVRGVDAVLHAAGVVQIGWTNQRRFEAVNVEGTRLIAQAARAAGCRMVFVSTINTIGTSSPERPADEQWSAGPNIRCPYVVTKQQAEEIVLDYAQNGLDALVVNPALMFGPWDWKPSSGRLFLEVTKLLLPVSPPGGSSVCDVRDVAQGILLALKSGKAGNRYVLAGENITYYALWRLFVEAAGKRRLVLRGGRWMLGLGGGLGDLWGKVSGREPELNSAATTITQSFHYFSSHRAQEELGYTFRPARDAVFAARDWFREHGYMKGRVKSEE